MYLNAMADYYPFAYYSFLNTPQLGKYAPNYVLPMFLDHVGKECGAGVQHITKAQWILHVKILERVDCSYSYNIGEQPSVYPHYYCQVLDTIKGKEIPSMDDLMEVYQLEQGDTLAFVDGVPDIPDSANFIF